MVGIVDVRQVADRQRAVTKDAEQQNGRHDQRGHDRAANEKFGDIHDDELVSFPRRRFESGL